jgi:hypothetical protein
VLSASQREIAHHSWGQRVNKRPSVSIHRNLELRFNPSMESVYVTLQDRDGFLEIGPSEFAALRSHNWEDCFLDGM